MRYNTALARFRDNPARKDSTNVCICYFVFISVDYSHIFSSIFRKLNVSVTG